MPVFNAICNTIVFRVSVLNESLAIGYSHTDIAYGNVVRELNIYLMFRLSIVKVK